MERQNWADEGCSCIGRPRPTVDVKLSGGDHGEILIRNPVMFSHYLGDEAATQAAFTEDGFFRTGDVGRKVGEDYVLEGRASSDIIKNGTYKVSLLEVEQHLHNLPFIQEACIVPVLDSHNVSRVAALVRFEKPTKCRDAGFHLPDKPSLAFLRDQLASTLPVYMLPTALRILREGEYIPQTASQKPIRTQAAQQYFQSSDDSDVFDGVELCDNDLCQPTERSRPWDTAGK
ncbi:hypothetical protein FE257_008219 [Aspergillus nanangensis]|uniref:AMP-binding enzyme C-terminal domain-containing protein n=1 Tax=Aspergillus nanangensis TaxID=2582783 RepID=A0AAD4GTP4_ASPNN|nr:hypothetical protein FE257_008219 [Aspergillus nanangensis]